LIEQNRAANGAGMAVVEDASLQFVGAETIELRNNSAARDGGALLISSTELVSTEAAEVIISGNDARRGGGVSYFSKWNLAPGSLTKIHANTALEVCSALSFISFPLPSTI
jgi:hypothetical protein